jgi:signal peptidase II
MGWVAFGVAVTVVLLDQATKAIAVRSLAPGGMLSLAANRGWWLGRVPTAPVLVGLWSLALGCAVLAATGPALAANDLARVGLVVALAGATSNLCDWLRRGGVIDFIALGWWPTFNLADVAIVVGVAVALGAAV